MPKKKEKDEVIPIRVKPQTVWKLQADVVALEQDVSDKQKTIDELKSKSDLYQETIDTLKERVDALEIIKP